MIRIKYYLYLKRLFLKKKNRRIVFLFLSLFLTMAPFQNCGKKIESASNLNSNDVQSAQNNSTPIIRIINGNCSTQLNKCATGSLLDDADTSSQYKWSCQGTNGGTTASCSLNKPVAPTPINGACSTAINQCTAGSLFDDADTSSQYKWSCQGTNGGTTASCSLNKPVSTAPTNVQYDFAIDLKYPGVNGEVAFDFYVPKDFQSRQNIPVFIWVHGGGWAGGDKADDRDIAEKIASRGFIVLNLNYTLAPSTPVSTYPTPYIAPTPYTIGVRDILAAVELVKSKATDFHMDTQKISIGGGSAGGHLTLMTSAARATNFNCVVSVAGPTDLVLVTSPINLFPATSWIAKSIFGDRDTNLRAQSPLHQVNNILANKIFLLHAEKDNLVPVEQARNFYSAALPRFQNNIELTILNDPLPAGYNYYFAPPEQLTHNLERGATINHLNNFLGTKCY